MLKVADRNGKEWEFEEKDAVYRKSVYGCAIYQNKVLMVLDPRSDKWELPGGGVDEGESDEQALVREIKEETGLDAEISNLKFIVQVDGYYKSLELDFPWKTDRSYFQIDIKNPDGPILANGNGNDVTECKWLSLEEINSDNLAEIDRSVIQKVLKP